MNYIIEDVICMKYTIILEEQEEGGFTAQCLEIPGAISQGETKKEALDNVKEAIELVLEVLQEEAKETSKNTELIKVDVGGK
jgi:predicted RNase H-like HicB family nuclease